MEEDDKGCPMIRMGVSGWVFLLVPAYPGCPRPKAVKWLLCVCVCVCMRACVRACVRVVYSVCSKGYYCILVCHIWKHAVGLLNGLLNICLCHQMFFCFFGNIYICVWLLRMLKEVFMVYVAGSIWMYVYTSWLLSWSHWYLWVSETCRRWSQWSLWHQDVDLSYVGATCSSLPKCCATT